MFCFFANNNCYLQEIRNYTEWVQVSKIWISVLKQEREREKFYWYMYYHFFSFFVKLIFMLKDLIKNLFCLFYFMGTCYKRSSLFTCWTFSRLMKFLWILIQSAKVLFKNALQISLNFTLCSFSEDSSEPFNFQNCFLYNEMKTLRYSMTLIISLTQIIKIIKVLVCHLTCLSIICLIMCLLSDRWKVDYQISGNFPYVCIHPIYSIRKKETCDFESAD